MPTLADASAELVCTDLPVLFLDTCSLLDIVRAPARKLQGCVASAVELCKLVSSSPSQCRLVVSSLVPDEWNEHVSSETAALSNFLAKLEDEAGHFHDSCAALGIGAPFPRFAFGGVALADRLAELSKNILDGALHLESEVTTIVRAHSRSVVRQPPAGKGGQIKDCTIIEECLEVCRQLRAAGFNKKLVYCTSNTNDYCDPNKDLKTSLAAEFASFNLEFASNLPWAVHLLKNP